MLTSTEKLAKLINSKLAKEQFGKEPFELYEPIRYLISIGGKRMRPLLTLLGYKLFKDDVEQALDPALGIEIFHNFTLMHDDIMDEAPLRRGKKTVHEKWNTHTAILSGDVMLVKAYDKFIKADPLLLPVILAGFNKCAAEVCEGQQWDMIFETNKTVSEVEYVDMIRQKTAVLLGFSLELGAILANADDDDQKHIRLFGESLGIGFQLKDDLLDVYGDSSLFGKRAGGDIIANKKTYLLIKALEVASKPERKELLQWIGATGFNHKKKINAVKSIYDNNDIVGLTNKKIHFYYKEASKHLNAVKAPLNRKAQLKLLAQKLVDRER